MQVSAPRAQAVAVLTTALGLVAAVLSISLHQPLTLMVLSSEVETKRRPSSMKVTVFTAPKW